MSKRINDLFTDVHKNYDMANHIYSMGVDIWWRKEAVKEILKLGKKLKILDIATGTADLPIALVKNLKKSGGELEIVGIDFNKDMLKLGNQRIRALGIDNVKLKLGDALSLPFKDKTFDVAISGFALRNFDDLDIFAKELRRVLKPGGRFVILEMGRPSRVSHRALFNLYFGGLMKPIGYTINKKAYKWLLYSINNFDKKELVRTLRSEGLKDVKTRELFSGVGFLATGRK